MLIGGNNKKIHLKNHLKIRINNFNKKLILILIKFNNEKNY